MIKLLIPVVLTCNILCAHRRVSTVSQFIDSFSLIKVPQSFNESFSVMFNSNFSPIDFEKNHERHGPSKSRPRTELNKSHFVGRNFKCPSMRGMKQRLDLIEKMMSKHYNFLDMKNVFNKIKNSTEISNQHMPSIIKLPDTVSMIEEMEKSMNNLMKNFQQTMRINHIQTQTIDPVIEQAISSITQTNEDTLLLSKEQKTELQNMIKDISKSNDDLNLHVETINTSYSTIDEALSDLPNLFQSLVDKVNHMDDTHHDTQIVPGSAAENNINEINNHIDKIEQLASKLKNENISELETAHNKLIDLHDQHYQKLNNIKIIEDGINDSQEKKADLANQVLTDLNNKSDIADQPYVKSFKNVLETLSAISD